MNRTRCWKLEGGASVWAEHGAHEDFGLAIGAIAFGMLGIPVAVLQAERDQLMEHLQQTEQLLREERDAADRADARHTLDLRVERERLDEQRRQTAEHQNAAMRAITAEKLGA